MRPSRITRTALATAMLLVAARAHATGGLTCRPSGGKGPIIGVVIGHGMPPVIVGASLRERGRTRSTLTPGDGLVVAGKLSDRRLHLDLVHLARPRPAGSLRVRFLARRQGPVIAVGSFARDGRSYPVSCEEG